MNPYDISTTKAKDLRPGDVVTYSVYWDSLNSEGWRSGSGRVVRTDGPFVYVIVSPDDAKFMELRDNVCRIVEQHIWKAA